jgi:hypothetical protein
VRCTCTGRSTIKDFDESATRRESPGDTETDDAGTNDGDLWFADAKEAVGQEAAPFAGMTQTGSTGVISAATIAAPLADCTNDGDFRASLQALHGTRQKHRKRGLVRLAGDSDETRMVS